MATFSTYRGWPLRAGTRRPCKSSRTPKPVVECYHQVPKNPECFRSVSLTEESQTALQGHTQQDMSKSTQDRWGMAAGGLEGRPDHSPICRAASSLGSCCPGDPSHQFPLYCPRKTSPAHLPTTCPRGLRGSHPLPLGQQPGLVKTRFLASRVTLPLRGARPQQHQRSILDHVPGEVPILTWV